MFHQRGASLVSAEERLGRRLALRRERASDRRARESAEEREEQERLVPLNNYQKMEVSAHCHHCRKSCH